MNWLLLLYTQRRNHERKEIECFVSVCIEDEIIASQFCIKLMFALTACFAENINMSQGKELARNQYMPSTDNPLIWNDVHKALGLPQPDPLWTQTVLKLG